MAEPKKDKAPQKKKSSIKVMSQKDCKTTKGGMVTGGLAGPEDFGAFQP